MIMQAHYKLHLEAEASSVKGGQLSDMEREDYQKRINDLLDAVSTLLDANRAMGEKLDKTTAAYDDLKAKYEKLVGELAMRKRDKYGKCNEKPKASTSSGGGTDKTKDEDEEDYIEKILTTTTHKFLLCFTNTGRVFKIKGYQIPETASRSARGTARVNILKLQEGERIRNIIPLDNFDDEGIYLTVATKSGIVKRTPVKSYANINKNGLIAVNIRDNDKVVDVAVTTE